jgi:hypothetical protein
MTMKKNVSPIAIAIAVIIAVALIGFIGYQQMKPAPSLGPENGSPIPSFIDPVTHKPKTGNRGSGVPAAQTGANGAPAAGQSSGGQ